MENNKKPKTLDERIEALTQSVELLTSIHKDNEARQTRLQNALMLGVSAFLTELSKKGSDNE